MNPKEFSKRRRQLMRMMGSESIAILPAAPERMRNRNIAYRYRQDSDFFYLSGFNEPESVLVLIPGRDAGEYILFCRERNADRERLDGVRAGTDGAISQFDADDAFPMDDIDEILPGLMERSTRVYYTMGVYEEFDRRLTEWIQTLRNRSQSGAHTPQEFVALEHFLHDMRLYKSRAEIAAMRRSAKICVAAHKRAIQAVREGIFEYEIEAEFDHEFRRNDATAAYPSIVGSGSNACVLHYVDNKKSLADGELVLIDAGCEFDSYASDLTRTYPVNGKYSPEQRAIYDIVLRAQLDAIEKVRPGNHWNDPHDAAVRTITKGLRKLGVLSGTLRQLLRDGAYREFFMHRTGHWIGIDVHDVGDYKVGDEWRVLEPGMVTTIEPGIYISEQSAAAKKWRGIGVRIEDDVALTRGEPDVLSKDLPKDADEIEALMQ